MTEHQPYRIIVPRQSDVAATVFPPAEGQRPVSAIEAAAPSSETALRTALEERLPALSGTHRSLLDVGAILRAIPRYRLQGLWVQYTGDGTDRARHNEVVVSIQYGWPGLAMAEQGHGRTVKGATDALLAALRPKEPADE